MRGGGRGGIDIKEILIANDTRQKRREEGEYIHTMKLEKTKQTQSRVPKRRLLLKVSLSIWDIALELPMKLEQRLKKLMHLIYSSNTVTIPRNLIHLELFTTSRDAWGVWSLLGPPDNATKHKTPPSVYRRGLLPGLVWRHHWSSNSPRPINCFLNSTKQSDLQKVLSQKSRSEMTSLDKPNTSLRQIPHQITYLRLLHFGTNNHVMSRKKEKKKKSLGKNSSTLTWNFRIRLPTAKDNVTIRNN